MLIGSYSHWSYTTDKNYYKCSRRVLPPPPDVRRVVDMNAYRLATVTNSKPLEVISSGNTMIIGDYIPSSFNWHDAKWLVQATGNAMINTIIDAMLMNDITVDRHYIFVVVRHNQLRYMTKSQINTGFWQIINIIRQRNKHAKIFISALLPRPVDNQEVKPLINKFNRAGQEAGSVSAAAYSIAWFHERWAAAGASLCRWPVNAQYARSCAAEQQALWACQIY